MFTATVIELLVKRAWYRTLARIRRMGPGAVSPETYIAYPSPAARLPLEVIKMIISYLLYDTDSLRACTLTCYSWYIVAVPHLHHTLTIKTRSYCRKSRWPNPLQYMHMLGLLPLVKKFQVYGGGYDSMGLSPKIFNCCILRQFLTLTNVRVLYLEFLDIPSFMPRIQRYFGHFSPTVRSLALREPKGSHRQIIYFIGLFQHLQDLKLTCDTPRSQEEPAEDLSLIPPFVPPLRGWLKLVYFTKVDLLKDMIDLFGGLRFRYMHLLDVDGMRLLLDACAETLEILVLYPTDPHGKFLSFKDVQVLANNFIVESSLQDFDLSRNKSLRKLEFPASSVDRALNGGSSDAASSFLKHVLSTITSSVFFDIIILFWDRDFRGVKSSWPRLHEISQAEEAEQASQHHRRFELLREVHKVRNFRLVLSASVSGDVGGYLVRVLEEAVAEEKAKGGFDSFFSEPLVLYNPQDRTSF